MYKKNGSELTEPPSDISKLNDPVTIWFDIFKSVQRIYVNYWSMFLPIFGTKKNHKVYDNELREYTEFALNLTKMTEDEFKEHLEIEKKDAIKRYYQFIEKFGATDAPYIILTKYNEIIKKMLNGFVDHSVDESTFSDKPSFEIYKKRSLRSLDLQVRTIFNIFCDQVNSDPELEDEVLFLGLKKADLSAIESLMNRDLGPMYLDALTYSEHFSKTVPNIQELSEHFSRINTSKISKDFSKKHIPPEDVNRSYA